MDYIQTMLQMHFSLFFSIGVMKYSIYLPYYAVIHLYVDVNVTDKLLNTPLHAAVRNEQTAAINFLLEHGADPTLVNDDEMAAIHLAVDINAKKSLRVCVGLLI